MFHHEDRQLSQTQNKAENQHRKKMKTKIIYKECNKITMKHRTEKKRKSDFG